MIVKKSQSAENEWIKMVIRKIKAHEGLRQREIAERVGVNWQYFSGVANGRYALTDTIKDKLFYQFPYLSNGEAEGEMLNEPLGNVNVADGFPLYNIEASANLVSLFDGNGDVKNVVGRLLIPNAPKCDGAIYVRGDSMEPLLKSGDIIAYKSLPCEYSSILYGEMYIVDFEVGGEDFVAVKFLHRSDKGEEWVKLTSYNDFYEPKDIHLSCFRSLALVKFSIRMNTIC